MTTIFRTTGNTQVVVANAVSQLLTFAATGSLLINVVGGTGYVNIGTANTVTATIANATTSSSSVPVQAGGAVVLQTGQSFNQEPGAVYVAVIGTGNVFVTPVSAN